MNSSSGRSYLFKPYSIGRSSSDCTLRLSSSYTIENHLEEITQSLHFKVLSQNRLHFQDNLKLLYNNYKKNFTERTLTKFKQLNINIQDFSQLFGILIKSKNSIKKSVHFAFFIDSFHNFKIEKICFENSGGRLSQSTANKIQFIKISFDINGFTRFYSFDSRYYNIYLRYNIDGLASKLNKSDLLSFNKSYFLSHASTSSTRRS
jgi:hypothetical protein